MSPGRSESLSASCWHFSHRPCPYSAHPRDTTVFTLRLQPRAPCHSAAVEGTQSSLHDAADLYREMQVPEETVCDRHKDCISTFFIQSSGRLFQYWWVTFRKSLDRKSLQERSDSQIDISGKVRKLTSPFK